MNRYITVDGHILELPILLGLIILILVAVVTVLILFFGFSLKRPGFKRMMIPFLGLALLIPVFLVYNDSFNPDHEPESLSDSNKDIFSSNSVITSIEKQPYQFRYTVSKQLNKLGFVRNIYDDGSKTYFKLNSLNVPTVFIEDISGNLIDQKDHISIQTSADHPFPILIVNKLSMTWYLQFTSFISHITQNPIFKPSYDTRSVEVSYSDIYYTTLVLFKDSFVCDQLAPQDRLLSIPRSRHYFIFEDIRYYINDCFDDYSSKLPTN